MCKLLWQLLFSLVSGLLTCFCWCRMLKNSNSPLIPVPTLSPLLVWIYVSNKKMSPNVDRIFVQLFLTDEAYKEASCKDYSLQNFNKALRMPLCPRFSSNCSRHYFSFAFRSLIFVKGKRKNNVGLASCTLLVWALPPRTLVLNKKFFPCVQDIAWDFPVYRITTRGPFGE